MTTTAASADLLPPVPAVEVGVYPYQPRENHAVLRALTENLLTRSPSFPGAGVDLTPPDPADIAVLAAMMQTPWTNTGDADDTGTAGDLGTKTLEQAVIRWFTGLVRGDPGATYGYVTSDVSEATHHALAVARERMPRAPIYVSTATHGSVARAAHLLRMDTVVVHTRPDDTMDPAALRTAITAKSRKGARGAIVVPTIGTTMTGASDNLAALREAAAFRSDRPVHIHVDAALGGLVMPWTQRPLPWDMMDGADSIAIGGRMLGLRQPGAVVLEREYLLPPWQSGSCTGGRNRTLAGGRSGLLVADMWLRLRHLGYEGLGRRARSCLANAQYAAVQLSAAGLRTRRSEHSITVPFVLPGGPSPRLAAAAARWNLPVERRRPGGALTRLVIMPHVTRPMIDEIAADLAAALHGSGR